MIDTCAKDEHSYIPYFYSDYGGTMQSVRTGREKIVVLGAGPIRIGQGVEFDYSTVHAVKTIKEAGYEAIIINNNPETVSTDYTTSDKLYFEPLTTEDVMRPPSICCASARCFCAPTSPLPGRAASKARSTVTTV